jgi:5'-3' exonuclease
MGIPFYFASLLKSHPGIVEAIKRSLIMEVDVLGVDFNCLIHRYLKEEDPIQSVLDAFEYITQSVCKPKKIFIAMDGLVPYAKIVQQRYRRMRVKEEESSFDRNQISPDTPYMRDLETALRERFPFAHISSTQVPGEGEHKLFKDIAGLPENQRRSICIYGLDADLILISLQNHKLSYPYSMNLLRESKEFNDPKLAKAEFATLSIWKLLKQLPMDISQYMALSVLCFGNDFMPNLALFSLREDGYDRAIHMYEECGKPDLLTKEGRSVFLKHAASQELDLLRERVQLRRRPEEKAVFGRENELVSRKFGLHNLDGVQNVEPVVESFWKTFEWTLYYFQNNEPLNWNWVYPYPDAPLISDIVKFEEAKKTKPSKCRFTTKHQLSFILPENSLKQTGKKTVYPDETYTETRHPWMKRHDWEMKPRISLPWNPQYDLTHVEAL